MRIFISYSHLDSEAVEHIASRLRSDGHEVWVDFQALAPGDNILEKVEQGLGAADVLIVVISKNSLRSQWALREFSAIAFQQISKRQRRIIPIRLDQSEVPSYLADRLYVDLSEDFHAGLESLSAGLKKSDTQTPGVELALSVNPVEGRAAQLGKIREALRRGRLTLMCGAGVSVQAGIPVWGDLLIRLLERMIERIAKTHALKLDRVAAAEFQRRYGASSLILGKYLKNNLGKDFPRELRDALYASPSSTSPLIESIVRLSRPQRDGRPLDSIITFNFDSLIEENLETRQIPNRAIFSEAIAHDPNELPIYHVHGYLPRIGDISEHSELVFSEDAYHSQFIEPFSWSNLIQLNKLTQNTCLLVGISLTDPNMRRLLDVAWRKSPDKAMSHCIIKRTPRLSNGDVLDRVSKLLEEQDANALGLNVVWIDEFRDIPTVLDEILSGR
ncbi:TIR domain-containing protein [Corallococcus exercitus]|uniref:TIR domain-containing protein n=1 Tax=Corallococcus exercitus TaxID=2316736 RepID=A0A7Y4JMG7_9BACT|nr:TIR domain-containing protein [Corallococcus exercitus]NOK07693.1 TIR domain-containing protein [Corallococcus exercitus]